MKKVQVLSSAVRSCRGRSAFRSLRIDYLLDIHNLVWTIYQGDRRRKETAVIGDFWRLDQAFVRLLKADSGIWCTVSKLVLCLGRLLLGRWILLARFDVVKHSLRAIRHVNNVI